MVKNGFDEGVSLAVFTLILEVASNFSFHLIVHVDFDSKKSKGKSYLPKTMSNSFNCLNAIRAMTSMRLYMTANFE